MRPLHLTVASHAAAGHHYGAAVWSGVIAGAVFIALEMMLMPLFAGMSPWAPVRMMAAIVMGTDVLPPPATFDLGIAMVALLVHFTLAIALGLVFALVFYRLAPWPAVVVGGLFGFLLYLINFYGFTAFFPWFAMARGTISIISHIVFGAVLAYAYEYLGFHRVDGRGSTK